MSEKIHYGLIGETTECSGVADSILEAKEKIREKMKGTKYDMKEAVFVKVQQ